MSIVCNNNGTICKKVSSDGNKNPNNIANFVIGSIGFFLFLILMIWVIYIFCCRKYIRDKLRIRCRSHKEEQSINVDNNPS